MLESDGGNEADGLCSGKLEALCIQEGKGIVLFRRSLSADWKDSLFL